MSDYVVELKNITKRFPGVVALKNMGIQIKPGEIHGLIGENGAGKSTLIKVLTGVHQPEEGQIYINGKEEKFRNPNDSAAAGVACVYQELNIEKMMSITDNIYMNKWIRKKNGLLDYAAMNKTAKEVMASLGVEVDPRETAGSFGMGVQQMIEIAKAILIDARMIIMDEPTSSLGGKEVELLMTICRKLKKRNIAILFVSHKLEELFELCDRVTVMRDGEHIWTKEISETDNKDLITAMVGRSMEQMFIKDSTKQGECALKVENLEEGGIFHNISFEAYYGQILGFAGLVGAGRSELMRAIFGADPLDGGRIYINGKETKIKSPRHAIKHGMAFLTEDRKGQGLILANTVQTNLILANLKGYCKGLFIDDKKVEEAGAENLRSLRIKTPSQQEIVGQLSGGNQQKVVIGKWLNCNADIYIFDEPTRGIDVGAKVEVYNVMNNLAKAGKCVIMVSSEMPEILGMSDRIIVMREGRIMATITHESECFNQEDVMKAAWGGKIDE